MGIQVRAIPSGFSSSRRTSPVLHGRQLLRRRCTVLLTSQRYLLRVGHTLFRAQCTRRWQLPCTAVSSHRWHRLRHSTRTATFMNIRLSHLRRTTTILHQRRRKLVATLIRHTLLLKMMVVKLRLLRRSLQLNTQRLKKCSWLLWNSLITVLATKAVQISLCRIPVAAPTTRFLVVSRVDIRSTLEDMGTLRHLPADMHGTWSATAHSTMEDCSDTTSPTTLC
mmetsp:Transcript_32373/g.86823  ORF Transcript_32373/g.86823 Transcript_32373/m.86823 type:complete len:223 (+) Transcript_32373:844-1512(+)